MKMAVFVCPKAPDYATCSSSVPPSPVHRAVGRNGDQTVAWNGDESWDGGQAVVWNGDQDAEWNVDCRQR